MRMRPRNFSLNGLVAVVGFPLGITISLDFFTFYPLSFTLGSTMWYSHILLFVTFLLRVALGNYFFLLRVVFLMDFFLSLLCYFASLLGFSAGKKKKKKGADLFLFMKTTSFDLLALV